MRYSNEPRDGRGVLSFAKNMGSKYVQNLLNRTKKLATDALKTTMKNAIKKKQPKQQIPIQMIQIKSNI